MHNHYILTTLFVLVHLAAGDAPRTNSNASNAIVLGAALLDRPVYSAFGRRTRIQSKAPKSDALRAPSTAEGSP